MNYSHIPEEKLIDYILGNVAPEEMQQINNHIQSCPTCRETLGNWSSMLREKEEKIAPELKNRLWESVHKENIPVRKNRKQLLYVIGSAAAIFLLAISVIWYKESLFQPEYQIAQNEEINSETIQLNADTIQMEVVPLADYQHVTGSLWMNDREKEMLLEVDGLINHANYDYQLWFIYQNNDMDAEILSIFNGSSKIYIKGMDVEKFKLIKASLEPIGGSTAPTGPETFIIPVGAER